MLALLAAHRDKVVPREQLMTEVWDENWFGSTKTLDVTIGRLRQKLEEAGSPSASSPCAASASASRAASDA